LKPGDHLIVECTQDQEGFFYAVNVLFQKEGTAAERADASRPVMSSTQARRAAIRILTTILIGLGSDAPIQGRRIACPACLTSASSWSSRSGV